MLRLIIIICCSIALLLLIGAGVAAVQLAEIHFAAKRGHNQVVLRNHAKETVSQGEVRFGQCYGFQRFVIGETPTITIPAGGEGGYVVDAQFESGRKLSSEALGYLTFGAMKSDLIEIQDDKIILVRSKVVAADGREQ